jgi:thiamine monophosphate synthase
MPSSIFIVNGRSIAGLLWWRVDEVAEDGCQNVAMVSGHTRALWVAELFNNKVKESESQTPEQQLSSS